MTQELHDGLIRDLVDYLLPELTPYEVTMYLLILRRTVLNHGDRNTRIGKRTIASLFAKGSRGDRPSYEVVSTHLKGLEEKGCLRVGDTTRDGTLYTIILPRDVPAVVEKISVSRPPGTDNDYFSEDSKRRTVFERDNWLCQYCGERVLEENATLDHYVPQSKGGDHSKDNLRTACLVCNSIKSGRSYEDAAPLLLSSIRERKARTQRGI